MNFRTSKGAAKILFLLPALAVAAGLVYYMHHTGKIDLSVLRKWQVEATNLYNKTTDQSGEPVQEKVMTADLDALSATLTEEQVIEQFRDLALSCYSVKDAFGDYACSTAVALFNDTRAKSVAFYFLGDRLTSLRVAFDAEQRPELVTRLQGKYGPPMKLAARDPRTGRGLEGWKRSGGTVAVSEVVIGEKEASLLWMTKAATARVSSRQ